MTQLAPTAPAPRLGRPRLGFLGVGWIGRHRLQAIAQAGAGEIAAIVDPSPQAAASAASLAPDAAVLLSLDDLLNHDLDGIVIATPSALHARQSIAALERGLAVFCQKPLARTADETRRIIDTARRSDRLLGVDLSYRHTEAFRRVLDLALRGNLGRLYAIDLTFHNAYGPDKPWFRDPALSGGGCVIDLGVHLVDLALLLLGKDADVESVSSRLFAGGRPLTAPHEQVEDFAVAQFTTSSGAAVRFACSWNLSAGQDCIIDLSVYGDRAGAAMRNVNGSFYDFRAERFTGTHRETLAEPPDAWGGRAVVDWAERLARGGRFDPECERLVRVADVLDRIYGRPGGGPA